MSALSSFGGLGVPCPPRKLDFCPLAQSSFCSVASSETQSHSLGVNGLSQTPSPVSLSLSLPLCLSLSLSLFHPFFPRSAGRPPFRASSIFFVVLDLRYVRRSALHTTTGTAERRAARFLCARVRDSSYKCKEKRKERGGQKVGAWCACTAVRGRFSVQATHFVGRRRP